MAVLSKIGITNSQTIQASHITQSIDALTGQVTDYAITISGSLTLTGSFRIANGTITSSGAISSSAGLFGTTLVTSGAITSSGAISSSAGLFGTTVTTTGNVTIGETLTTTGAITSSGAISSSAELFGTTLRTTGAITSSGAISSSAGLFGTTLRTSGAITSSGAISSSAGLFGTTLRTTGAITSSGIISSSALITSNITATSIAASDTLTLTKTGILSTLQTPGFAQLYLNGPTLNRIDFNTNGVGSPILGSPSTGSKIVLYPAAGATTTDYAIGIEPSTLWFSIPSNTNAVTYNFYGGTSSAMRLRGDGILTLATHSSWPPSSNPPPGSLAISGSGTAMRLMLWNGGGWVAQA